MHFNLKIKTDNMSKACKAHYNISNVDTLPGGMVFLTSGKIVDITWAHNILNRQSKFWAEFVAATAEALKDKMVIKINESVPVNYDNITSMHDLAEKHCSGTEGIAAC